MNKLNRFVRYFLYFLALTVVLSAAGYYYFSNKVLINPIEYAQFNKAVPVSKDTCAQKGTIKYYSYENIPKDQKRNNKFGIYIYPDNEKFIELADDLVNSGGGEWGYVLLPYNVQDEDAGKWRRVFYLLNKHNLIPIVQLWNIEPAEFEKETREAAQFLNQFTWPIRQKYVSVYNEPNSSDFWYGRIDPKEYAQILDYTIDEFKKTNENFFMLNGGLNVSARSGAVHMDAFVFMDKMDEAVPGIFEKLDGWASHSYPQPNFSGSPYATGRDSIRAYKEELKHLEEQFGVEDLPVFITETGWAHDVGRSYNPNYLSLDQVTENFKTAYEEVWLPDDRVKAVTPFTIWYEAPADHFAWVDHRWVPYKHFQEIKKMDKIEGNPEKLTISSADTVGCK